MNRENRYSCENLDMAIGVANFFQLNYNDSTCFIDQYKVSVK